MRTAATAVGATELITPYGGRLVDLYVGREEHKELERLAATLPRLRLSARLQCDLELLATGAFSPLDRFMRQADYRSVCSNMRLAAGSVFPIPVTLPTRDAISSKPIDVDVGAPLALCDGSGIPLALMTVDEVFDREWATEARDIFGSASTSHPVVSQMHRWGDRLISGALKMLRAPEHYDFEDLRLTPLQVRRKLQALGRPNVVAFNTRNPMHRVHEELTKRAMRASDATLLIHPVVGVTRPGDVDANVRVRIYRGLVEKYYSPRSTVLALLPLAMRMAGPREAVWHAIIRRNFGASHFIVGRDHAGLGSDDRARTVFDPDAARTLAQQVAAEIGVNIVGFPELVYMPGADRYVPSIEVPPEAAGIPVSGTRVRRALASGEPLPPWVTRPETAAALATVLRRPGFCVWLTGLSGAGKSTIAGRLGAALRERGRRVTVLDGDLIRGALASELGFSKRERDENVSRTAFFAAEIVRHDGAVVVASQSPFAAMRDEARHIVGAQSFLLVYLDTSLAECRRRDPKGLYARADAGLLELMIGVDEPFEVPGNADLVARTESCGPDEIVTQILEQLQERCLVEGV